MTIPSINLRSVYFINLYKTNGYYTNHFWLLLKKPCRADALSVVRCYKTLKKYTLVRRYMTKKLLLLLVLLVPSSLFAEDAPLTFPPLPTATAQTDNYHIDIPKIKAVADKGNPLAEAFMGDIYYEGWNTPKNIPEALKWYRKAAEDGNAAAQTKMGAFYQQGAIVPKSYDEAVKWFHKAADQNDAAAMSFLGVAYNKGNGVTKDVYAALTWFHKAADKNNFLGQFNLCTLYYTGDGVVKDYVKAYVWCSVSQNNVPKAQALVVKMSIPKFLKEIETHLDAEQLATAKRLLEGWRPYKKLSFLSEY